MATHHHRSAVTAPPPGLPAWWFDRLGRTAFSDVESENGDTRDPRFCGYPSETVAFHWCTGTNTIFGVGEGTGSRKLSFTETNRATCVSGGFEVVWGEAVQRRAVVEAESGRFGADFVVPRVTAFKDTIISEQIPGEDLCGPYRTRFRSTLDARIEARFSNLLSVWDNFNLGTRTLPLDDHVKVASCGTEQLVSLWNTDCISAMALRGLDLPPLQQLPFADAVTGAAAAELGDSCYLLEPRRTVSCPEGMVCNSGGTCVNKRCVGGSCEPAEAPAIMALDLQLLQ